MAESPAVKVGSNAVRDMLLGEDTNVQAEFILNLIEEAAEGREVANVISDVIQVGWVTEFQACG
jgi:hypothetical protein